MNRLRELREDRDLRQIDVAKAVGLEQKTLSNYENEVTNPDSFAIIKLAEFFGVTCDYLLGVSDRNITDNESLINEVEDIKKRLGNIQRHLRKN
ncbi:MAG: helix-turn-helix transcriptional regulator [Clostridia bacterium]|nr:helix-turn-helix transcriptional regulator [Clostridia bacterium]